MTKLEILAKPFYDYLGDQGFKSGFKAAFNIVNELIDAEITKVSDFPWMGERIHALNLYRRKMNEKLEEMEKENV